MLANVLFDPRLNCQALPLIGTDDQDGIVASDGSNHFRPFLVVDACRDRLCASCRSEEYEQVHCLAHLYREALQNLPDIQTVFVFIPVWKQIS